MRQIALTALLFTLAAGGLVEARPNLSSSEFNGLKKAAQRAMKSGQFSAAGSKLRELGKDDSKRAVDFLCSVAKIPDPETYGAAMDAISQMRSEEAEAHILKRLSKSGKPAAKMLLVDAMAERADPFAGKALGKAVMDKAPEVQRAAVSAIKRKKLKHALDGLIELLERLEKKDPDGLNYTLVQETLTAVTGESFEKAEDWKNFWEPRKQQFRPVTGKVHKKPGGTMQRKRPSFFGSEIRSNRLVFVIDTSGSMQQADPERGGRTGGGAGGAPRTPTGGPGGAGAAPKSNSRVRIERAKFQLIQAVNALPKDAHFTILAYSGVLVAGPGGQAGLPKGADPNGPLPPKLAGFEWLKQWKPKLMPANGKNKQSAVAFVKGLQANGGTFTLNALKHAIRVANADTIVVLSDGYPNDHNPKTNASMGGDEILKEVKALNRMKRMVIDTFGFDPSAGAGGGLGGGSRIGGGGMGSLGKFMQDLASQNGGRYTQIK
jgi:VWA domain-containing protein